MITAPFRYRLIIILGMAHLLMLTLNSRMGDHLPIPKKAKDIVGLYSWCAGGTKYNFYGGDTRLQIMAKCYMLDSANHLTTQLIGTGGDPDEYRTDIMLQVINLNRAPELCTRLIAAKCFRRHPALKCVKVCLGSFYVPGTEAPDPRIPFPFRTTYSGTYVHD